MRRSAAYLLLIAIVGCRRPVPAPGRPSLASNPPAPVPVPSSPSPTTAPTVRPVLRVGGDVSEPLEVSRVHFRVPPELQRTGADWTLILGAVIEADGRVTGAHALRPVAPGTEPCVAFIAKQLEQWRYKPARKAGEPVAVDLVVSSLHCPCCVRPDDTQPIP